MSEYTKGRLEYSSAGHGLAGKGLVIDEYFVRRPEDDVALAADVVCPETGKPSEANARRLVACWNACEGIPTDVLEKGRISSDAFQLKESRGDAAEQRCEDLLNDLVEAAAALRRYEALHRAKGTDESTAKAEVNAALATRFEATVANSGQQPTKGAEDAARRVSACIAACKNISTKALESGDLNNFELQRDRMVLTQQRDELIAAFEEVLRISDRKHDAWDRARVAIASAKGEQLNPA